MSLSLKNHQAMLAVATVRAQLDAFMNRRGPAFSRLVPITRLDGWERALANALERLREGGTCLAGRSERGYSVK